LSESCACSLRSHFDMYFIDFRLLLCSDFTLSLSPHSLTLLSTSPQVLESMALHRSEMTSSLDKSMSMAREQQRQLQQPPPVTVAKVVAAPQPGKGTNYTGNSRNRQYFTGIKRRFTTGTIGLEYTNQEKCCPFSYVAHRTQFTLFSSVNLSPHLSPALSPHISPYHSHRYR
jgi:hypothetical protein